jgi:hypothetical protein
MQKPPNTSRKVPGGRWCGGKMRPAITDLSARLDSRGGEQFNARMKCDVGMLLVVALVAGLLGGCATKEQNLPPMRVAVPARSPQEVLQALPGTWTIDVAASAEVMARQQFQPREAAVTRRDGFGTDAHETAFIADRFDPQAYHEARKYWADVLSKPDMRWQLTFRGDGTGENLAVVQTGQPPAATPFTWKLDGWRLHVEYPADSKFKSFEVEAPSAVELNYPMQPLGDHLVLRRTGK